MVNKIEIKNVVKKFGAVVAVDHFSFSAKEGEVLALLGPSGCGKTTVLRSIAGLETINEGEIYLDGELVNSPAKGVHVPPEKRSLGLVFQSYSLWPHMRVRANLEYALKIRKYSKEDMNARVKEALELVGLTGLEERYPSQLSGGQQQRVALARSLAYSPKVLLLDEPLSNLDLKVRERMRGELQQILGDIGITAMYVTHDQEEAFVICNRVIVMNEGKLMQDDSPRQIYESPANLFVADFIGRANMLKASLKSLDEKKKLAQVFVPQMNAELLCNYDCEEFPKDLSLILIRHNEIGIYESKPDVDTNLLKGKVSIREYRGSITDHKVRVGDAEITVTTHKFCKLTGTIERKDVYVHIPPQAIKPVYC